MSYLAYDSLNPRLYILACNVDAVVVESTEIESKLVLLNRLATSQNSVYPNISIAASNDVLKLYKNSNVLATYNYFNNFSMQATDIHYLKHIEFFGEGPSTFTVGPGISYSNNTIVLDLLNESTNFHIQSHKENSNLPVLFANYVPAYSEYRIGINTSIPSATLHVRGDILATGSLTASNLTILGDTVVLDTITSNTEQLIITNKGNGPALKVTQEGENPVAEFYDDANIALMIADGGNIGIGKLSPNYTLDVNGTLNIQGNLYQNDILVNLGTLTNGWVYDANTSNLYYQSGNVGIGTTIPLAKLHTIGSNILDGFITTNNNSINAGTGTITAATFSGTATQVSQNLIRGTYLTGNNYNGSATTTWTVDADTANTANKIVARDASGNFSAGTITATLSGTATQVSQNLLRGTYLTGNNYNGSVTTTWTVDADTANTANKIVARDASGNFSAGTITATLSGTATQVSQNLIRGTYLTGNNYNGSATTTWTVDADTANIANKVVARDASGNFSAGTITATLSGTATQVSQNLVRGTYLTGNNYNGSATTTWAIDADTANTANKIVARDASGNFSAGTITATLSGTATQVSQNLVRGTYLTGDNYNGASATTWTVDADTAATPNKIVARDSLGAIYVANVGIGTTATSYQVHIQSSESVLTVQGGKVGIAKGAMITPSTDLEIRNSSSTNYTGILVQNDGNLNPSASIRVMGIRYDQSKSIAYSGHLALQRYNDNAYLTNDMPLGFLHFGGNHTSASTNNRAYSAYIGAISEEAFTTSSNMRTAIVFKTGSNAYQYNDTSLEHNNESMRINADGNIGIGTTQPLNRLGVIGSANFTNRIVIGSNSQPKVSVEIYGTDAILVPKGTTAQRPNDQQGYIRFNTETQQFEGLGAANQWGSLGGVKSTDQQTYISAELTPGANDGIIRFYNQNVLNMILNSNGNLGIGTDSPAVSLDIQRSDAISIPIGSTAERPTGSLGYIRFNTDTEKFEGFGQGNKWASLGGSLINAAGDTYILADYTFSCNDKGLHFYTSNVESMILTSNGFLGIGTINPREKLDINGNVRTDYTITTSNLVVLGTLDLTNSSTTLKTPLQVQAIHDIINVQSTSNTFYLTTDGIYGGYASNVQIFKNQNLLTYYSPTIKDYDLSYTHNTDPPITTYTITLTSSAVFGDILDITIWPQIIEESANVPGYVYQQINVTDTYFTPYGNDVAYISGNVGIGTSDTTLGRLVVAGNIVPASCNVYDLGTSNLRWKDIYLAGTTIDLGGTKISRDPVTKGLLISDEFGNYVNTNVSTLYATNVGIGTTVTRQLLDVQGGNAIISGNIGIGTIIPNYKLHVIGESYLNGTITTNNNNINAGSGTITAATFSGTATQVSSTLTRGNYLTGNNYNGSSAAIWDVDATTDITVNKIVARDAIGSIYASNVGIGTNVARALLDVQGGNAIVSGNIGIGTVTPNYKLHVIGDIFSTGNLTASNVSVIGDFVTMNTVTSNTEQMVITNAGTGPALKVTQTGNNSVAEFYDAESGISMKIDNTGTIGIGTTAPRQLLDVQGGNAIVSGNIGIGTTIPSQKLHVEGTIKGNNLEILGISYSYVPQGGIILWSGSTLNIPSGWALCDGTNGTPDLRNRFIVGAGSIYSVSSSNSLSSSNVTLTIANLPDHEHTGTTGTDSGQISSTKLDFSNGTGGARTATNWGGSHTHPFTTSSTTGANSTPFSILPPYYALAYIMKL